MRKTLLIGFLMLLTTGVVYGQQSSKLGQCLSGSTTATDKKVLVRWIAVAMLRHPALSDMNALTQAQVDQINASAADVFIRLVTVDCKTQLLATYKTGGEKSIEDAFGYLGEAAMGEVVDDPHVAQALEGLLKYIDQKKLAAALSGH